MKQTTLVGRKETLRAVQLLRAERRARGEADLARIVGPPGIGKTAFLDEVLASTSSETICVRAFVADQLKPFVTLGRLLGTTSVDEREAPHSEAKFHETSITHGLSRLLRGRRKAVVAVDDAHWLDQQSRTVLLRGVEQRAIAGLLLVEREGRSLDSPWPDVTVRLEPLRAASAAELARRTAPGASSALIEEIVRAASGVPFGIVLLARALMSQTPDDSDIVAIIARRLARESPLAETIACLVAEYRAPAPVQALGLACKVEPDLIAMALSALSDLIQSDGENAYFRHAILRDIVHAYDPTPSITTRTVFEVESRSGDNSASGLRRLRDAARRCGERRAFIDASIALGSRLAQSNAHHEAALVLGDVWDEHRALDGHAVREYLDVLRVLGRDEEAVRVGRIAFHDALAREDGVSAARIAGAIVHGLATLDRDTEISAFLSDAASRPAIAQNADATSYLHGIALSDAAFDGDLTKYDALAALAPLEIRDLRADAYARALRGDIGGSDRAIATWRASHGSWPVWDDSLEVHRRLFLGGPAACETWFTLLGRARIEYGLNAAAGARTWVLQLISTGRWGDADTVFASVDPFQELPEYRFLLLEMRLMLDALRADPPRDGRRVLDELHAAIGAGRRRSVWPCAAWWVAANARSGDSVPDGVASFVAACADGWPRPSHLAAIPLSAVLSRPHLSHEQAVALCTISPQPGSPWLDAQATLANSLLAQDVYGLRAVRDAFDSLAAPAFAMIAGLELPEPRERDVILADRCRFIGISSQYDREPLSPREREIAQLVARGESNSDIGMELGIAVRTVETHLTSIYRKLRIRRRGEVASRLI